MQFFIAFAGITYSFAQGTAPGREKSKTTKTKTKKRTPKKARSKPKKQVRTRRSKSSARKGTKRSEPTTAKLNIKINEPNSKVFISNKNGDLLDDNFELSPSDGSPLVLSNLRSGKYTIIIRKDGFVEEKRDFDIKIGKPNIIAINLRPSVSYLSIVSNVEKTKIELKNLENYETQQFTSLSKKVDRIQLPTGNYTITIAKEGYISQIQTLKIDRTGQEKQLIIMLKPVSIDKYLEEAERELNNRFYEKTIENSKMALKIEANNPKANLLLGLASYHKGVPGGGRYLLKALELGEEINIPISIFQKEKGKYQLISGNLIVNKNSLEFRNSYDPKLNFTIYRNQIRKLVNSFDKQSIAFVKFEANGLFNGKKKNKKITLYSNGSVVAATRDKIFCSNCSQTVCGCDSAIGSVYTLLFGWQN
jgi:hypothetical protein